MATEIEAYTKKNGEKAYQFRAYIGFVNGKRKYVKRRGFNSKKEARSALLNVMNEIDDNVLEQNKTFKEVYDEWLIEYEKSVINSTYYKTTASFKNHILPVLENFNINEIKPKTIQDALNVWCDKLKFGKKLLGYTSQVMKYAVREEYIEYNPCTSVTAPKIKREIENKKNFYNVDELKEFMSLTEKTNDIKKIALFRVLAFTGIRKGELLALEWDDYANATLSINKAISRSNIGLEVSTTKTQSSVRLISLDKKTCDIIDELHQKYPKSKRIFESENGGILSPAKPRKWLLSIIQGSDLQAIPIHGFRHTHASLIFDAGMSLKQAQSRLGHSDLKTTMNIYTHITQKATDDIAEKFSKFVDF